MFIQMTDMCCLTRWWTIMWTIFRLSFFFQFDLLYYPSSFGVEVSCQITNCYNIFNPHYAMTTGILINEISETMGNLLNIVSIYMKTKHQEICQDCYIDTTVYIFVGDILYHHTKDCICDGGRLNGNTEWIFGEQSLIRHILQSMLH